MIADRHYDVAICGGGLAGLGLARQLSLHLSGLRILVLEKQPGPLPAACHKVGESTVEGAGNWLCRVLQLEEHIQRRQLRKFGLRFFTGGSIEPFQERIELGASTFSVIPSYQLDRGVLENELREMVRQGGVELREGCSVASIEIAPQGPHQVRFRTGSKQDEAVTARWVIDALGRRRLLQTTLGLEKPSGHKASACWWRMAGEIDIDRMVGSVESSWRQRVQERRWLSTNHLMGDGYWVWLIPLSSGATSVGIVASEAQHPIRQRSSYPSALEWLRLNEPCLARLLGDAQPLDFLALKHFAHQAKQVFSEQRWCTIGEAGVFTDPLYSHGSDLIAWASTITTQLIRMDLQGDLQADTVKLYNQVFLETVQGMTGLFEEMYAVFGHDEVMLHKLLWDSAFYWAFVAPVTFKDLLERPGALAGYLRLARRFAGLNRRFQGLCRLWAASGGNRRLQAGRYGFRRCQWVNEARLRLLEPESDSEFLSALGTTLDRFEETVLLVEARTRQCGADSSIPLKFPDRLAGMQSELQQYSVPVAR